MRPDLLTPLRRGDLTARVSGGPAAPARVPELDDAPSDAELMRRAGADFARAANTFEVMAGGPDGRH